MTCVAGGPYTLPTLTEVNDAWYKQAVPKKVGFDDEVILETASWRMIESQIEINPTEVKLYKLCLAWLYDGRIGLFAFLTLRVGIFLF